RRKPPEKHNFVYLRDWFAGFEKAETTNFPKDFLKKARRFYDELSKAESFLIHGDFHHENILSAGREPFLVIDPKGIVGQTGYEISVFLNNHVWWLSKDADLREKLDNAVTKFSEAFEIERQTLRKWAYAQTVLSAWWTFEENGKNWQTDLALADVWEV
ncbi:MAG TPA: aminoglycoside phosphotransferase family protein, partial [Pyrinomonadaceae bacterium]|nr:aminoglycoside phosphotransferase family protein [Pyrinomonadaceae bacterium]